MPSHATVNDLSRTDLARSTAAKNGANVHDEPAADLEIAIIGMGCRFPGASNLAAFWQLLYDGVDAIREVPADRWSASSYFSPAPSKPGKTYSRWGGFLDNIDLFDPAFFGISPREAAATDPQQRLLLEVAWQAIEDAGLTKESLVGRPVSVFVGASSTDYLQLQSHGNNLRSINAYTNSGNATSIISNRLSYFLDLRGPSLTVDTACSSSLVAFHYACESLRRGESEVAIVGGVNLLLWASSYVGFSQAQMLSPDGRCRSFDALGNGYVRSEGAGALILKPLRCALADGDAIQAVVLASGVNQDGRTAGMSMPNEAAQAALLDEVYARAKVDTRHVSYLETHGTGTPAGDPIEARAIGRALGLSRSQREKLPIGSVKSNIGHLEPASGIAGIIKTVLAMKHRTLPSNLHFQSPNPAIDFETLRLRVVAEREHWQPVNGSPRIAGVNSFGFGGTNAHVVLSEHAATSTSAKMRFGRQAHDAPDAAQSTRPHAVENKPHLIPLSAHSEPALRALAHSWRDWLDGLSDAESPDFEEIAYSAAVRRTHHPHRLAIVSTSVVKLRESLDAWLNGEKRRETSSGHGAAEHHPIAFVFDGMGSQWQGMGEELLNSDPVFARTLQQLDGAFQAIAGWSIIDRLRDDEFRSRMSETEIAQPCIFAMQVGLAAIWKNWGIEPDFVVGHSVGEVAAAYTAGALSLRDAVKVIYHRSRLQHRLRGRGRMLAIGLPEEHVRAIIARHQGFVSVAAMNSPVSVTLSGDQSALEEIECEMQGSQTFCRFLQVDVPYHSPCMDEIQLELESSLSGLKCQKATVPFFSTVTGNLIADTHLNSAYWFQNARQPVLFSTAMAALVAAGARVFVEIGAHPVLVNSMAECVNRPDKIATFSSLKRNEPQSATLLSALGRAYAGGGQVRWNRVFPGRKKVITLPDYVWQREAFWYESPDMRKSRRDTGGGPNSLFGPMSFTLLGQSISSAHQERAWHASISIDADHLWLADHKLQGTTVFPAAGFIEQALSAGRELYPRKPLRIEQVQIDKALVLTAGRCIRVETLVSPNSGDFQIDSQDTQETWTRHANGRVRADFEVWDHAPIELRTLDAMCHSVEDPKALYESFASIGLEYGPHFQAIETVTTGLGVATGRLRLPGSLNNVDRFTLYPVLLDACLQLMLAAATNMTDSRSSSVESPKLYLPAKIRVIRVHDPEGLAKACLGVMKVSCRVVEKTDSIIRADAVLCDESGRALLVMRGFEAHAFPIAKDDQFRLEDCLLEDRWEMRPRPGQAFAAGMPSPTFLVVELRSQIPKIREEFRRPEYYRELQPAFEAQALSFAENSLQELKCDWIVGQKTSISEMAKRLGIVPERQHVFKELLNRMALGSYARVTGDRVEVLKSINPSTSGGSRHRGSRQEVGAGWPTAYAEQLLASRTGPRLAEFLRGEKTVHHLLVPDGSMELLEEAADHGPSFAIYNRFIQELCTEVIRQIPRERPIRVLEIVDSPSWVAEFVLPLLPAQRSDYTLANRSADSFGALAHKSREYSFFHISALVSDDLIEQGFESSTFDIVICPPSFQLSGVIPVLAADGLILIRQRPTDPEATSEDRSVGWHALRMAGKCRDLRARLESAGFQDVQEISDAEVDETPPGAIWVARAPSSHPSSQDVTLPESLGTWWITADAAGVADSIATRLARAGGRAVLISASSRFRRIEAGRYELPFDDVTAYAELCGAAQADQCLPTSIVHLACLDDPIGDDVSLADLRRSQAHGFDAVLALVQAIPQCNWNRLPRLWIATRSACSVGLPESSPLCLASTPIWGLLRVLANEMPHVKATGIDLSPSIDRVELDSLFQEVAFAADEREITLRGNRRYVPRLDLETTVEVSDAADSGFRVAIANPGNLDTVSLVQAPRVVPRAGEVEIEVSVAAINFKDIAKALHLLSGETLANTWSKNQLGLECAGRISAIGPEVVNFHVGDRVLALASDCFRSHLVTTEDSVTRLPGNLSLNDAAGIPIVFLTAWYALHRLARLQAGERVLIHAAAGGVGLAAVQIAQAAGAEVIATAGSLAKREYLKAQGIAHVFDSRSLSFVDEVLNATDGQGVDVVLNSLSGPAIPASLGLLRPEGRFVELGKRDIQENVVLGLRPFQDNLAFFALDMDRLLAQRPAIAREMLDSLIGKFSSGELKPIPHRVFPISRVGDALRYVAKARHIGKVLLDARDPLAHANVGWTQQASERRFSDQATYLVTGGLSGFGMATAKWLVEHGAKHLALLSRRGASTIEAQQDVMALKQSDVAVSTFAVDVADEQQLKAALETIRRTMPPLVGVFHAAMVLDDAIALQLTPERAETVLAPKAWGAWNLHRLTRADPLEHFVLFSSATTIFGNPSQASYVAACTFLDRLSQHRHARGMPSLSVAWGAIADIGYLSKNESVRKHLEERVGLRAIPAKKMLDFLETLLWTSRSCASLVAVDWSRFSPLNFAIASTPRFASVAKRCGAGDEGASTDVGKMREQLDAISPHERGGLLRAYLKKALAHVLGTSPANIESDRSVLAMGLDSLMAVELQMELSRDLQYELSPMQLLRGPSIDELTDELLSAFGMDSGTGTNSRSSNPPQSSSSPSNQIASAAGASSS